MKIKYYPKNLNKSIDLHFNINVSIIRTNENTTSRKIFINVKAIKKYLSTFEHFVIKFL